MPYPIFDKLVIAVASRSLFNLEKEHDIFTNDGETKYRQHQIDNIDKTLDPGVAFPFIKRVLELNKSFIDISPIEVIILSRNDPESGQRFFRSCRAHNLNITRGAFTTGRPAYPYINSFNAALYLSADKHEVEEACRNHMPAGHIIHGYFGDESATSELRVAFDFDGVLADDASERLFRAKGLEEYLDHEQANSKRPLGQGLLQPLLIKLSKLQRLERKKKDEDSTYQPIIRVAIVTARNAPAHERVIATLNSWNIRVDDMFLLGGVAKSKILDVLRPHLFFDDQLTHLEDASIATPCVHIPFGVANSRIENR